MLARDALRLHASRSRSRQTWVGRAADVLRTFDATARLLDPAAALVSLAVAERLRELLPDEYSACRFGSPAEQEQAGAALVERFGGRSAVTLHLGYGPVAFAASLEAAWFGWRSFCHENSDAYNACLYPASLAWYVVCSGAGSVYPMDCEAGEQPRLAANWLSPLKPQDAEPGPAPDGPQSRAGR